MRGATLAADLDVLMYRNSQFMSVINVTMNVRIIAFHIELLFNILTKETYELNLSGSS